MPAERGASVPCGGLSDQPPGGGDAEHGRADEACRGDKLGRRFGNPVHVEIAGVDPGEGEADTGKADEVRPHGAAREDGFDVVHDESFLRWDWNGGRPGRGAGSLRRGGFGRESEGLPLDRRDARLPAATEGRPRREALEEGETLALKRADGLPRLRALRSRDRCRPDDAILGDREDALQEPRRAPWAGVHREVEDGVVETRRQVVAASRVPEEAAVDRGGFGPCQRSDIGGGGRGAPPPPPRRGRGGPARGGRPGG